MRCFLGYWMASIVWISVGVEEPRWGVKSYGWGRESREKRFCENWNFLRSRF